MRLSAYRSLSHRKDSLFQLMEAVLAGAGPATIVRLSLAAVFRRAWSSAPDALADGDVDTDRRREPVQTMAIEPPPPGRPVWALDGTVWPRPAARTSPERTYGHHTSASIPQDGVVPAWEYEWLVDVPAPGTGWIRPLDTERRGPNDGTPTAVAIGMLRKALARRPAAAPFTVVRVQLDRLPRRASPPAPLWLAWIGDDLPRDLADLWRDYILRFTVEHGFRFLKQALGWTTVRPRNPAATDRWTWLLVLALWQLWLARSLVADQRLPWERPLTASQLTPGRVRRAFPGLFASLGTPARPPNPRGKAPGRRPGHAPGPRSRHPVARGRPKRAA